MCMQTPPKGYSYPTPYGQSSRDAASVYATTNQMQNQFDAGNPQNFQPTAPASNGGGSNNQANPSTSFIPGKSFFPKMKFPRPGPGPQPIYRGMISS